MSRLSDFAEVMAHRNEVRRLGLQLTGYGFPFHDLLKAIGILLVGDKIATKLHRRFSRHHDHVINGRRDIPNKVEAAIDWESARFTKPDKPLNAYQTWKAYYSDIDMEPTLRKLGLMEDE